MYTKEKEVLSSAGKSSQSTETKGICILVLKDDLTGNNVVAEMLQHCAYEILYIGDLRNVLQVVLEKVDRLDHVVTNVYNVESEGTEIARCIGKSLGVGMTNLNPGGQKIERNKLPFSSAAYLLHGLGIDDMKRLQNYAFEKVTGGKAAYQEQNTQRATNKNSASISEAACSDQTRQRTRDESERSEDSQKDPPAGKKNRVVWSHEMHQKFLQAIEIIGYEKAVPKKIVEVMGIPWLTRENVASHLQKHRGSLKRNQEATLASLSGNSTISEFERLLPSSSRFNSFPRNMTPSLQSSYTSVSKESINTWKSQYLDMHGNFSFGTTIERKNNADTGGFWFGDQCGADGLQQRYVHRSPLAPNFRLYSDHARNMLVSVGNSSSSVISNQSSSSKFVGYRLTNDGNSIEFGDAAASVSDTINREPTPVYAPGTSGNQSTSYIQHNLIPVENPLTPTVCISQQPCLFGSSSGEASFPCQPVLGMDPYQNSAQCFTGAVSNSSQEQFLLSMQSPRIGSLIQSPSTPLHNSTSIPQMAPGNENTETCCPLLDQDTSVQTMETLADAVPFQIQPEDIAPVQNSSPPSSIFLPDQDFSMLPLETQGDEVSGPDSLAFFEGNPQQTYSPSFSPQMLQNLDAFLDQDEPDGAMPGGTGSPLIHFDLEEFDDELF